MYEEGGVFDLTQRFKVTVDTVFTAWSKGVFEEVGKGGDAVGVVGEPECTVGDNRNYGLV